MTALKFTTGCRVASTLPHDLITDDATGERSARMVGTVTNVDPCALRPFEVRWDLLPHGTSRYLEGDLDHPSPRDRIATAAAVARCAAEELESLRRVLLENCDCLTGHQWGDATLPHYSGCAAADAAEATDASDVRALAELASFRDIDTALYCLRQLRIKLGAELLKPTS
jgi:hypothetical protein